MSRAHAKPVEHDDPAAVDAWMRTLDHPLAPVVEGIRKVVLSAGSDVTEGIKWKSPSFYLNGWVATVNVRGKQGVTLVLHLGSKVQSNAAVRDHIDDPKGLLTWHSADRASIAFSDGSAFDTNRAALRTVVAQWLGYQRGGG